MGHTCSTWCLVGLGPRCELWLVFDVQGLVCRMQGLGLMESAGTEGEGYGLWSMGFKGVYGASSL